MITGNIIAVTDLCCIERLGAVGVYAVVTTDHIAGSDCRWYIVYLWVSNGNTVKVLIKAPLKK